MELTYSHILITLKQDIVSPNRRKLSKIIPSLSSISRNKVDPSFPASRLVKGRLALRSQILAYYMGIWERTSAPRAWFMFGDGAYRGKFAFVLEWAYFWIHHLFHEIFCFLKLQNL